MKKIIAEVLICAILLPLALSGCATHYDDVAHKATSAQQKPVTTSNNEADYKHLPSSHRILAAGSHVSGAIMGS